MFEHQQIPSELNSCGPVPISGGDQGKVQKGWSLVTRLIDWEFQKFWIPFAILRLGLFTSRIPCQAGRLYKPFQYSQKIGSIDHQADRLITHMVSLVKRIGIKVTTYERQSVFSTALRRVWVQVPRCFLLSRSLSRIKQPKNHWTRLWIEKEENNPLSRKHSWDVIQFHINLTDWPFMHAENSYDCNPIMMSLAVRGKIYEWLDSLDLLRQSRLQLFFFRLNCCLFGQICILNASCLIIMIAFQLTLPFKWNSLIGDCWLKCAYVVRRPIKAFIAIRS